MEQPPRLIDPTKEFSILTKETVQRGGMVLAERFCFVTKINGVIVPIVGSICYHELNLDFLKRPDVAGIVPLFPVGFEPSCDFLWPIIWFDLTRKASRGTLVDRFKLLIKYRYKTDQGSITTHYEGWGWPYPKSFPRQIQFDPFKMINPEVREDPLARLYLPPDPLAIMRGASAKLIVKD